ncbi:MAG TPA: hypothetical protein PLN68_03075, partial [Elusimicrobiales bacterium]|nr:hypothetical protein [Elusimicrobiales bacterium]
MAENKKIPPIPPLGFPSKPANKPAGSVPQIPSPITPRVSPPSFQKPQAQEDRGKEEREKLEKKIAELEKSLSEEREKVLALTIKNQQEEVLAAKLENSIRDVEEKIKRTQQEKALEEEKNQLKAKIKELETRLIQERETWMQTLKSQIKDKEKESKDIEEHFILRFQEFERKFLDEKAQWQKAIFSKDEEIKNIKLLLEQKTRIEEDYKRLLMEREGDKKEIERLKESLNSLEKERISLDSYIKLIPEKEKEIIMLKNEISNLKILFENEVGKFKNKEEALNKEILELKNKLSQVSEKNLIERQKEIEKIKFDYEKLLKEKELLISDINLAKTALAQENFKLKNSVSEAEKELFFHKEKNKNLELEKKELASELAKLIEANKVLMSQNAELKAENENMHSNLKNEINKIEMKYSDKIRNLEFENSNLTQDIKRKENEYNALLN